MADKAAAERKVALIVGTGNFLGARQSHNALRARAIRYASRGGAAKHLTIWFNQPRRSVGRRTVFIPLPATRP